MHDLLPQIPEQLNNVFGSIPYFMPEIYLTVLFLVVLVADLFIGRRSVEFCKMLACGGLLDGAYLGPLSRLCGQSCFC